MASFISLTSLSDDVIVHRGWSVVYYK